MDKNAGLDQGVAIQELPNDAGRLAALCSLWQGDESRLWIALQGGSMMPTFLPGSRLHVHCVLHGVSPGDVIVFRDQARLVAHRLIKIVPENGDTGTERLFHCLGDGNVFPDPPVRESAVLGRVIGSVRAPLPKRLANLFLHPRRHWRYLLRRLRGSRLPA